MEYRISDPDFEDSMLLDPPSEEGRRDFKENIKPIYLALVYPVLMLGFLMVLLKFISDMIFDDLFRLFFSISVVVIFIACLFSKKCRNKYFEIIYSLRISHIIFFQYSFNSFCAFFAALVFIVIRPKNRYLPLSRAVNAFKIAFIISFLAMMFLNVPLVLGPIFSVAGFFGKINSTGFYISIKLILALLGIPVFFLMQLFLILSFSIFFVFLVTIIAWPLAKNISEEEECAEQDFLHVSDLHVTEDGCPEFEPRVGRNNDEMFGLLSSKLKSGSYTSLVISGDITDSGKRKEWVNFINRIEKLDIQVPIIMAPGNHDLFPYLHKYDVYKTSLPMASALLRVRKIRYLYTVKELCPAMEIYKDGQTVNLSSYLSSEELMLNTYIQNSGKKGAAAVDAVWDQCFPMYFKVGEVLFICIDTNRCRSNFYTSAFGEMRNEQKIKLAKIIEMIGENRTVVVVGHHHMYTPPGEWRKNFHVKYLELLCDIGKFGLQSECVSFYLHGHRHYPFSFKMGNLFVRSAPSLKYN